MILQDQLVNLLDQLATLLEQLVTLLDLNLTLGVALFDSTSIHLNVPTPSL